MMTHPHPPILPQKPSICRGARLPLAGRGHGGELAGHGNGDGLPPGGVQRRLCGNNQSGDLVLNCLWGSWFDWVAPKPKGGNGAKLYKVVRHEQRNQNSNRLTATTIIVANNRQPPTPTTKPTAVQGCLLCGWSGGALGTSVRLSKGASAAARTRSYICGVSPCPSRVRAKIKRGDALVFVAHRFSKHHSTHH